MKEEDESQEEEKEEPTRSLAGRKYANVLRYQIERTSKQDRGELKPGEVSTSWSWAARRQDSSRSDQATVSPRPQRGKLENLTLV